MSKYGGSNVTLSFIIPVYNVEQYLKRCIDSVLKQLRDDMEVIIVDDGSKDSSGAICDQYRMDRGPAINVIHQTNGGLSAARNTGIENAHGEYLYFLDSDDYISDKFVETVYGYLKDRKYDIVEFGSVRQFGDEDINFRATGNVYEQTGTEQIFRLLRNEAGCQICFRIFKSSLFSDIRFPVGRNYEDIATYYKLLKISKINLVLNAQIHVYNLSNLNSITQNANLKNLTDMYLAVNEMHDSLLEVVIRNNFDAIYLEYYKRCIYIYILLKMYKADFKDSDIYQQIKDYLSKNNHYSFIKYKNYGLKKLCAYKLLKILHML